jgi:Putative transposase
LIAAWPVSVAITATTGTSSLSPALSLVLPRLPSTQSPLNSAHQILRTALNQPKGLPAFFLTLHTFDEYLDFHPDLHALVTEGFLDTDGVWHPAPEILSRVLEQLFSAQLLSELTRLGFISADLVTRMQT